ncbi:hypothetical protein BDR22DRAFT_959496 [Usnea florida]
MDWLPGLSNPSDRSSDSVSMFRADSETGFNTQTTIPDVDEVQYSIVCEDCGKHFWSRSKAVSHAALTAHVLNEEMMLSPSPDIVPKSPTTGSASAPISNTAVTSAIDAEVYQKADAINDFEDNEGSEDENESICFDCGRHFWSRRAAYNHAVIGHGHDGADTGPSSASGRSPRAATLARGMSEQTTSHAFTSINPGHGVGVNQATPGHHGYLNGTQAYGTTFQTNEHEFAAWNGQYIAGSAVLNPESQGLYSESESTRRRSPGVSPSPSLPGLVSPQHISSSINSGTPTNSTPIETAPPSPSSSIATIERSQVVFPSELSDRISFIVTPSGSGKRGPSFIMGLAEAQDAETFRTGVRGRLQSLGEQVGMRRVIAGIPWIPVSLFVDTDEDHYHMLRIIRYWPGWQKAIGYWSCHVFVSLEEMPSR